MATEAVTGSALFHLLSNPNDAAARERFVKDHGPSIQRWCYALCPQPVDAENLYQTVCCKLLEELQTFGYDPSRGRFRGWLRTVARNTWLNMLSSVKPTTLEGARSIDDTRTDWEEMVESFWERELFVEAIRKVRPRLNVGTWEAFQLKALEGRPAAEVAQVTDRSTAAVYVLTRRVTRMLQEEIAKLDDFDVETQEWS